MGESERRGEGRERGGFESEMDEMLRLFLSLSSSLCSLSLPRSLSLRYRGSLESATAHE